MHHLLLKRCGIFSIIIGLVVSSISLYVSLFFSLTVITELGAGVMTIYLGVRLIKIGKEQTPKVAESLDSKNGRTSPFYYELEPALVHQRALPPLPRDIGRNYDPVVMDKV